MTTPPGEPTSSANPSQPPVPPQPLPSTPTQPTAKPTTTATKKPRQRKRADTEEKHQKQEHEQQPGAAHQPQQHLVQPPGSLYSPRAGPQPVYQPYPSQHYMMNPSYPMNSGYSHHPQHPQPPPQQGSPSGPGMSGHPPPQYYPMGHYPPGYPYPYPQPMVMYQPPPRQSVPPETPHSNPSPVLTSAGTKRKRKSESGRRKATARGSDDDTAASESDVPRVQTTQHQAQTLVDLKKRTKTQRACDSCRSRKIRCDVITESDPPVCQHCKQYGFECTFFLPITETRFKKKRLEEEAADKDKSSGSAEPSKRGSISQSDKQSKRDVNVFDLHDGLGPTSTAHLLHSQATISSRIYETYDQRYQHTFEVSKSGDGLIQVQKPTNDDQHHARSKPQDLHIERDVMENLVNAYFADIAPMLPVITEAEFLATPNPPAILMYSMCLVAAARRDVPKKIFDSIRYMVNTIIKEEDVLSTASFTNLQAILILCMTADCHSQFVPTALSGLWVRLGAAIRMAQDLGLHRAESMKQNIELRRRLWGACLICDRWVSIAYGHPYMIDVQDCDTRLPSSGDFNDVYMDELVRLSILLGRVQKTIYSPSGLTFTTDKILSELLADMQRWKSKLPDHLKFKGPDTPQNAGLLHLLYSCVCMMFWRVFMRISYSCPLHLKFGLNVEQWSELIQMTSESIDWLDAHERVYDVWLLVAYAATCYALVQYHTCIRRKDKQAQTQLRKLRDCVRRWEGAISADHMSAGRKAGDTAEIIALLYEATQGPPLPIEAPALNPTGGVTLKKPADLDFKKDPTRPGGGVFILRGKGNDFKDVPDGVVISTSEEGKDSEGEVTSPATAVASSIFLHRTNHNDPDSTHYLPSRSSLSSSYRDRPSLPNSAISPIMNYAGGGIVTPVSAVRSPVGSNQSNIGSGSNAAPLVNLTPLNPAGRGSNYNNVNPAMNYAQSAPGNVQLMNVLDAAQGETNLADFAIADNGFLEGIPGGMFDWSQWDTFFSRFNGNVHSETTAFPQA